MGYLDACSFTYNGVSSQLYDLVICYDGADSEVETGLGREIVKGDVNMVRHKANQYGVKYSEVIPIEFMIMHYDGSDFTRLESRSINKWLQTDTYCPLYFDNEEGTSIFYKAICTGIEDRIYNGHCGKKITFECDSPFAYEEQRTTLKTSEETTMRVYNSSDDGIYYPIIRLSSSSSSVTITNHSDNDNSMELTIPEEYQEHILTINTETMQICDEDLSPIPFYKLGWSITPDPSRGIQSASFYWLRLLEEINEIEVEGDCALEILCEYPRKVGIV